MLKHPRLLALAAALTLALSACGGKEQGQGGGMPPPEVGVVKVQPANVPLQKDAKFNAMLEQRTAAHRWGTPQDLRGPLLLLASDAGAYMTGHTLVVDGGLTTILA